MTYCTRSLWPKVNGVIGKGPIAGSVHAERQMVDSHSSVGWRSVSMLKSVYWSSLAWFLQLQNQKSTAGSRASPCGCCKSEQVIDVVDLAVSE